MKETYEHTAKSMTLARLKQMNYGGCSPINRTPVKLCLAIAYVISTGLTALLMTLNVILNKHDTVGKFVEDTVMLFGFAQIAAKYAMCVFKSSVLKNMLHIVWTEFWPLDILVENKQKKEMLSAYRIIAIASHMYKYIVIVAISGFIVQAIVKGNRGLIADIWTPFGQTMKQSPYYELMFGFQLFMFPSAVHFSVIQIDMLFIIIIGLVFVQFRMLKLKLFSINASSSDNSKLIRECVAHHDMLLRFLTQFEILYSELLLPAVGSSMLVCTVSMYAVVMENEITRKLPFVFIYMAVYLQIFCYCYAGDLIQDEGLSVGQVAYECDWSEIENRDVKMGLIMIMIRSQRKINITCGGFMILSMENFSKVHKYIHILLLSPF
ncbi:Odorant receptor 67c [Carabus blaptoides fortunei]